MKNKKVQEKLDKAAIKSVTIVYYRMRKLSLNSSYNWGKY